MKETASNSIAKNIKKYRLLNNMTQEELAGQLYLDTQYYAQLERGERNFTIVTRPQLLLLQKFMSEIITYCK